MLLTAALTGFSFILAPPNYTETGLEVTSDASGFPVSDPP
jgi:hypothetical protein